jgi:segregation and condensation protein B
MDDVTATLCAATDRVIADDPAAEGVAIPAQNIDVTVSVSDFRPADGPPDAGDGTLLPDVPVRFGDETPENADALADADDRVDQPEPDLPGPELVPSRPRGELTPAQIIEALLFAADAPLSAAKLAELLGAGTPTEVRLHIAALNDRYRDAGLSFRIESIARGFQMMTQPEFRPWLAKLDKHRDRTRLSEAALETLSIVAYKQPIIRADVEAIRGVACGEVLNRLREMGLVKIVGRAEVVGRPMLYGTTRKFLDVFGLTDLDDLPSMETLTIRRALKAPEAGPPRVAIGGVEASETGPEKRAAGA